VSAIGHLMPVDPSSGHPMGGTTWLSHRFDVYSDGMFGRLLRVVGLVGLVTVGLWWGRLLAHSKKPRPEGRWRELDLRQPQSG
jgi:hypothetical protein